MPYEMIVKEVRTLTYEEQLNLMAILVEEMKTSIKNHQPIHSDKKKNCLDSYPEGYFDLFGSIDDPSFVEPEGITDVIAKKNKSVKSPSPMERGRGRGKCPK